MNTVINSLPRDHEQPTQNKIPNGAHERASHTTIATIYKGLMNKIGAGQVTIHYQSKNTWKGVLSCYN